MLQVRLPSIAIGIALALIPAATAPASTQVAPRYVVSVDSAHREIVITLGPYDVPADSGMEDHMDMPLMTDVLSPIMTWPMRTMIRGYRLTIEDSAGHPLSRRLLHHYGVVQLDRRELVYPALQNLIGGGAETDDVILPSTVGTPLEAGDRFAVYFMWKNRTGRPFHRVSLRIHLLWIAGNQQPRPTPVMPFWVDVNYHPGGSDTYDVPPGGDTRAYAFTLPVSGHLLVVGGHLHAYGSSMRVEDAETSQGIVRVTAHREPDGTVRHVSRKVFGFFGAGPHLIAGHRYLLVVSYDNPTTDTLRNIMGVLGGLFVPDDIAAWPPLDRTATLYIRGRELQSWEARVTASRGTPDP